MKKSKDSEFKDEVIKFSIIFVGVYYISSLLKDKTLFRIMTILGKLFVIAFGFLFVIGISLLIIYYIKLRIKRKSDLEKEDN